MKRVYLLAFVLLFTSCSLFNDKEEALTSKTWILGIYEDETREYFKQMERELVFDFHEDGKLEVTERGALYSEDVKWRWSSAEKDKIIIDRGRFSGELNISVLDNNHLNFWHYEKGATNTNTIQYYFIASESSEWHEDEFVDGYRGVSSSNK
jgi:hypothetical protein